MLNSILGEPVARVAAFKLQPDTEMTSSVVRQVQLGTADSQDVDGFKIKIIDMCRLEDPEAGDTFHYLALQRIAEDLQGQSVDCVLFVDRLDLYRVEPLDQNIMNGISDTFGKGVWRKALLTLTHSNLTQPPAGTTYETFVGRRIAGLRRAVRSGLFRPSLPATLVENSESCPVGQRGKRVLPDNTEWLVDLFTAATDMALSSAPYKYQPHMTQNLNRRFRWMIPVVLGLQWLAWQKLVVPVVERDMKRQQVLEDEFWSQKAAVRKKWGTSRPLRPSKERAWRLEQIYGAE